LKSIPLTNGWAAFVDDEDYERLATMAWYARQESHTTYVSGYAPSSGYGKGDYSRVLLHAFLMSPPSGLEVDHIDGDGLNNQRGNLRIVTHQQNMLNRRMQRNNRSGFRGVHFLSRTQTWRVGLKINGTLIHRYGFVTPEEAAHTYDELARHYHGAFARLNFPEEGERAA
jgi:hypothetical protein